MPKKKEELSSDFYFGDNADFYAGSTWMARNQYRTSVRIMELLEDPRIGGKIPDEFEDMLMADLGCGTGYSSYAFEEAGARIIGLDASFDMLVKNIKLREKMILTEEDTDFKRRMQKNYPGLLINGMIQSLPFRSGQFRIFISVSAFNFVLDKAKSESEKLSVLTSISADMFDCLEPGGRCVMEFYPKKGDIELYLRAFGLHFNGGMVIDNPGLRKEQKFLILKRKR